MNKMNPVLPEIGEVQPLTYTSESGSKYQVTSSNVVIKNGSPFKADDGSLLMYGGVTDYEVGRRMLNGELCSESQSARPSKNLIYDLLRRLKVDNIPFEEIGNHLDERLGIVSINHDSQRVDISAVIVGHQ